MNEEEIYKVDIEIAKIKDGWRGNSQVHGATHGFYIVKGTATDVLDSLMVDLKDTFGSMLDSKEEEEEDKK